MSMMTSRPAVATVLAAALSMVATPVMARGWGGGYRHHDRIDAGDVFAGILVLGGIAAIASAASGSSKKRQSDGEGDYRYPDRDYRGDSGRYGDSSDGDGWRGSRSGGSQGAGGLSDAVDTCVGEIERGDRRVYSVDNASRDGDGWRVDGRTSTGRGFNCSIDRDGRTRQVSIDGQAI